MFPPLSHLSHSSFCSSPHSHPSISIYSISPLYHMSRVGSAETGDSSTIYFFGTISRVFLSMVIPAYIFTLTVLASIFSHASFSSLFFPQWSSLWDYNWPCQPCTAMWWQLNNSVDHRVPKLIMWIIWPFIENLCRFLRLHSSSNIYKYITSD